MKPLNLLLGALLSVIIQPGLVAAEASPEELALGQELYAVHCAACHGADLEGEPNWRRFNEDGTLPAPPHDDTGHTWHHPDSVLFRIVKDGGQSVASGSFISAMPAFGESMSDDEIWAVLDFIKSRWSERSRTHQEKVTAANP